ncbi:MAG: peptide chain release factor 1 [Rhodospirillales bacterium]|nr:peptide chain release factor 1 [Rhodospirillales bacterium]
MSLIEKLGPIRARHEELASLMSAGTLSGEAYTKLATEYAELSPVVEAINAYTGALEEQEGLQSLLTDPDMKDMARADLERLDDLIPALESEIKRALLPKDKADSRNAILEIRAGTGGDEAALFAADLFAMYRGYAARRGWRLEVLEASESDLGGYREIICEVNGRDVFARLKYESGVHRVQRVPITEAGGRIHTSAATVAVLPEAEDVDIQINDGDLRVDTYRAQGSGGQHVNKTESAVRITHLPTGLAVAMQEEKSQHKNRDKAMKILRAKLYEMEWTRRMTARSADRKLQVGSGDRSERIRTYNFPQGRVTDHRINLTLYKITDILSGESLDEVIDPLVTEDQAEALAALS